MSKNSQTYNSDRPLPSFENEDRLKERQKFKENLAKLRELALAELRILRTYAGYYNNTRTHWSLDKDAPVSRPVQWTGIISSRPILGGLHHYYVRV
jgi:hypothetical protein